MTVSDQHRRYRFSATIATDDLAVVHCLRALSQHAQATGNSRIPWGGTKESDWRAAGQRVSFRFSDPRYRDRFLSDVRRLLPDELWQVEAKRDDDPARPQS